MERDIINMDLINIFEAQQVSQYLHLERVEMNDQQFMQLLAIRPSEINIILSRVTDIVKGTGTKSKRDLTMDVLDVLSRSAAARKFVGFGLAQEYKIFKGFPVRRGDQFENLPAIGSQVDFASQDVISSWTTNASESKKLATDYDADKGEPVGGIVLETKVDSGQLLFDVNAVIKVCRSKLNQINQYNTQAAPGKSLSKENTNFLGTEAPLYYQTYEIVTDNTVTHLRVFDTWTWDTADGKKVPKWKGDSSAQATDPTQPPTPQPSDSEETKKPVSQPPGQVNSVQESKLSRMFESIVVNEAGEDGCTDCQEDEREKVLLPSYQLEEDWKEKFNGAKDWILKTSGLTVRGKTLKYLDSVIKQYDAQLEAYKAATEFAQELDQDNARVSELDNQIASIEHDRDVAHEIYDEVKQTDLRLSFAKIDDSQDEAEKEEPEMVAEGALNLFSKISDAKLEATPKKNAKELERIFNRMIKALDKHFKYRLQSLKLQKELLEADFKNYQGTRFEKRPEVQKLRGMIDYTNQAIAEVAAEQKSYDSVKHHADDFSLFEPNKDKADQIKQEIDTEIKPEIKKDEMIGNKTKDLIGTIQKAMDDASSEESPFPNDDVDTTPTNKVNLNTPAETEPIDKPETGEYPATKVNHKTEPLDPIKKINPGTPIEKDEIDRILKAFADDKPKDAETPKGAPVTDPKEPAKSVSSDIANAVAGTPDQLNAPAAPTSVAPAPVDVSAPPAPEAEPTAIHTADEKILKNYNKNNGEFISFGKKFGNKADKFIKDNPAWVKAKVKGNYRLYPSKDKIPADAEPLENVTPVVPAATENKDAVFTDKTIQDIVRNKKMSDQLSAQLEDLNKQFKSSTEIDKKKKIIAKIDEVKKELAPYASNIKILQGLSKFPEATSATLVHDYDVWKTAKDAASHTTEPAVGQSEVSAPSVDTPAPEPTQNPDSSHYSEKDRMNDRELERQNKNFNSLIKKAVFRLPTFKSAADKFRQEHPEAQEILSDDKVSYLKK